MDQEKLLSLLMQYDLVSGSQISRPLGVTRAGVWKAIDALRAEGELTRISEKYFGKDISMPTAENE